MAKALAPPNKQQLAVLTLEQREKEETNRISKQRVLLRLAGELWLMGVLRYAEDGIATVNSGAAVGSGGVNGVKDNVAGFVSNATIKETKETKEPKITGEGFMYTVMKELVGIAYFSVLFGLFQLLLSDKFRISFAALAG
jgi:regulator of nonsense transcripts 2